MPPSPCRWMGVRRSMVARRWVGAGRQLRAPTTARRSPPPFNIVAIKDVCEDGRAVHIVMELFIVGELLDKIQEEGHYNERKAAEIKDDGLSIKAIDIRRLQRLKTMAIDIRVLQTRSGFTELIGSPYYVAPEVLHRYVIDQNLRYCTYGPKSDVWSATVVLNVLMSGVPPFWAVLKGLIDFQSVLKISDNEKYHIGKMLSQYSSEHLNFEGP
uniref:Protein kinase domain-containing protein n=1 Tax=Oryza rufipogon TaxID=4529 RepID=A0A0E0PB82_ORYRU